MARKLNNPDMPSMAYKYDIRIIGNIPQKVWDTAKLMNRLWNEFVACHDAACVAMKNADKETRKEFFGHLLRTGAGGGLYEWAKTYKGNLPNQYYWYVFETFIKAQKRFAQGKGGAPKPKFGLQRMLFPYPIGGGGVTIDWLHNGGRAYVRDTQGPTRGHFIVCSELVPEDTAMPDGELVKCDVLVPFEIVMDRPLPEGALIKRVELSGFHERPFEWKWSLIVSLQIPPHPVLLKTGRRAGLDLGWRNMGDGIRIGVLADNAGDLHELRLLYDLTSASDRKFIVRLKTQGISNLPLPRDPRAIQVTQRKMDDRLEACKIDLAGVDRSEWPGDARQMIAGVVKMRAGGLRRVRRALFKAGISYEFLEDWYFWHDAHLRRMRAAQIDWIASRNYLYRCIASWIANNYDVLGWEGDLGLKAMAEEAGKKKTKRKDKHAQAGEWENRTQDERILKSSQKNRQWASLHILRGYIREAMNKRGRDLQDHPAAYSTQICNECGLRVTPGAELLLECEDRHLQDQDVNAARRFLTVVQNKTRAVAGFSASVNHSQLLRIIRLVTPVIAMAKSG